MVNAKYNCSQDELYQACFLLAASLEEELSSFSFKPRYLQPTYVSDYRAAITAARLLPDEAQRNAQHIFLRTAMVDQVDRKLKQLANQLRSYIRDAYPNPTNETAALVAAGFGRYDSMVSYDWDAAIAFLIAAISFTEANATLLEANFNMPNGFPTELKGFRDVFEPQVTTFLNTLENAENGTQTKLMANNDIYDEAIRICEDGQVVFSSNEAMRHQFVWSRIIDRITPPGAAGLKVDVRNGATNEYEPGVVLTLQKEGLPAKTATTNSEGYLDLMNMEVGSYTGFLRKPGFEPVPIEFTISTGVISFKHYVINPEPPTPEN